MTSTLLIFFFFFFNDTATTEIYTLSLHDALPISVLAIPDMRYIDKAKSTVGTTPDEVTDLRSQGAWHFLDRKSTRLNSSHDQISYAVFCLKKKKNLK